MVRYKAGDIIQQRDRFVLVEFREDDIKNGRPGFEGQEVNRDGTPVPSEFASDASDGVWGYDDQITRVIRRA